ncbi:4-hydroxyphenylacetate 3-hydroxylase N-terminal domain-containing protein [Roseateles sp. BYS180W]|uniref:4-hydroxyphenylacetate 3-hydroxylase N-terminal domain-containing protein n=1 Tax=Roseateles rivi TaxID=3299028 RepID=A0ABW7FU27_9BURK
MPEPRTPLAFNSPHYQSALHMHAAQGVHDAASLRRSLQDEREVWYDGQRVDVLRHPAFAGVLDTLCELYELQAHGPDSAQMCWTSPESGQRLSLSYLAPSTPQQLSAKIANSHLWMRHSHGQLPRIPDFMANVVVGLYDYRQELAAVQPQFGANAERYYRYCREHDIVLTHAIGDPQIDRSASLAEHPDYALRVVERRSDGVVVRGAKQLATLAPYCHEVLVYLSPAFFMRESPQYVIWFALPVATPGLRLMCREAQSPNATGFRHDLSARYDEQDAMLFFDDVFVPNERIFLLDDSATAARGFPRLSAWALMAGQVRYYHRLRTFLGVASLAAQSIGVDQFREVADMLGELTSYVELMRLALQGLEQGARRTSSGLLAPGVTLAMDAFAAQTTTRVAHMLRVICGSGLVMQPSEADLRNPVLRPLLERYMCGKDVSVAFKSRLFRLAAELVSERFGMRQELYEMWNRGDVVRNRMALYASYPERAEIEAQVRALLQRGTDALEGANP